MDRKSSPLRSFEGQILKEFKEGDTLQVIGDRSGVSREAIRQFINARMDESERALYSKGRRRSNTSRNFVLSTVNRQGKTKHCGSFDTKEEAKHYFLKAKPFVNGVLAYVINDKKAKGSLKEYFPVKESHYTNPWKDYYEEIPNMGKRASNVKSVLQSLIKCVSLANILSDKQKNLLALISSQGSIEQFLSNFEVEISDNRDIVLKPNDLMKMLM